MRVKNSEGGTYTVFEKVIDDPLLRLFYYQISLRLSLQKENTKNNILVRSFLHTFTY